MIEITGSITRTFILPSEPAPALTFFDDITRVIEFTPNISLVHAYSQDQIRTLYESEELGTYKIRIYSDLQIDRNWNDHVLDVYSVKIPAAVPIEPEATNRTTTGFGTFSIQVKLFDLGDQTRIEFTNRLQAKLLRPTGMRLMPKRVVNRIAKGIAESRNRDIADGFIKNAIENYTEWLNQNQYQIQS